MTEISASSRKSVSRNTMVMSDLRAEVEIWLFCVCMRNASGHNYKNISVIMDLAVGHVPQSQNVFLVSS